MNLEKIEEFESIDFKDFINKLVLNKENSVNLSEELDDDLEKIKINDNLNEELDENKSEQEELELNELDNNLNEELDENKSEQEELDDDVNEELKSLNSDELKTKYLNCLINKDNIIESSEEEKGD